MVGNSVMKLQGQKRMFILLVFLLFVSSNWSYIYVMVHGQHVTLVILVAQTTLSSPRSL
jgi:hypothetical protein